MSKRAPESQPDPNQPDVSPDARQKWEDFHDSSPDLQDELKDRDEAEAWELYANAHEISREEALAGVRTRLHRLEQDGVEITPEIEQRELDHAEQALHGETRPRKKNGQFKKGEVEEFDIATASGLEGAVREDEELKHYEQASSRTARRIGRARAKEQVEIRDFAKQLRREDALTNVDNHIAKTAEQGARWWPWEKIIARRKAVRELKDKELTEDWLAYAAERFYEQQETYARNGESTSETVRVLSDSGSRVKGTWQKGGFFRRLVAMPVRFVAEGARLGWHGAKRGRKEVRIQQQKAKNGS